MVCGVAPSGTVVGIAVGSSTSSRSSLLPPSLAWLLIPSLLLPSLLHPPPVSVTGTDGLQPSFLGWEN